MGFFWRKKVEPPWIRRQEGSEVLHVLESIPDSVRLPKTPLVKIAKFAAIGSTTGFQPLGTDEDNLRLARYERWALKSVAEKALCRGGKWGRVFRCHRYRLGSEVEVWRDPIRSSASFRKLETCGGVWVCPPCSAKVSERRRLELVQGVKAHREKGGAILFLTLTFPHGVGDVLKDILGRFLHAIRWMTGHSAYQALREEVGLLGYVRALEVTHGQNGWHPHTHSLLFIERPLSPVELELMKAKLFAVWVSACKAKGLPSPSFRHGVDLKPATANTEDLIAEYVAKWGYQPKKTPHWTATHELTKANSKHGRRHGRTPWDLLRSDLVEDDPQALALFAEYADAFKGRSQLTWSRGLRAKLSLGEELTDQELAEQASEDENQLLVSMDAHTWRRVVSAKAWPRLLEAAARCTLEDQDPIYDVLAELPDPPHGTPHFDPAPRGPKIERKSIQKTSQTAS